MDDRPIAHLDSGALMALAIPADMHHDDAVRVCDAAVRRGGYRLVTSHLAVMEAMAVVRKRVTTSHKLRSGTEEERAGVDADAGRATAAMLKRIDYMANSGFLSIMELEDWAPDLVLLRGKVHMHAGRAVRIAGGRIYRYRGIGSCDWLHFAIAVALGASVICTTDAAWADVEGNDEEFGHIRIQTTGGPLIAPLIGGGA